MTALGAVVVWRVYFACRACGLGGYFVDRILGLEGYLTRQATRPVRRPAAGTADAGRRRHFHYLTDIAYLQLRVKR